MISGETSLDFVSIEHRAEQKNFWVEKKIFKMIGDDEMLASLLSLLLRSFRFLISFRALITAIKFQEWDQSCSLKSMMRFKELIWIVNILFWPFTKFRLQAP